MEQQKFIDLIKAKAIELQTTYNILASITISQGILESGYGSSTLYQNANNLFGIKYTEGCGFDKYLINTKEIINNQEVIIQAYFRKYNSIEDSIKDHAVFLQKERYKNIIGDTSYESVANKLYLDGYSTSSEYPSKLIKLIKQYGLDEYDKVSTTNQVVVDTSTTETMETNNNVKEGSNKMSSFGIDLGHGNQTLSTIQKDGGAIGFIAEETVINDVGNLVISKLKELGHTVVELRPTSATGVSDSLYQRYTKSDSNNCDICLSIHANAGLGVGTEIFTYGAKEVTEARAILDNIVSLGFTNRGIKDGSSLAMVKRPQATAMLLEICFVDSSDSDKYSSVGSEAIANAIVSGLTGSTIESTKYKVGWNEDNCGWFYSNDGNDYCKSCWKQIADSNNSTILNYYYFDENGYILTSTWKLENTKWYYLDQNGQMVQAKTPETIKWKLIGGSYYCFATDGSLYVDCITYDGWTINKDGVWDSAIAKK